MEKNVGKTDMVIRIIVGLAIGITGLVYHSLWGLLGIIPIATAFLGYCPLYLPFGIKTICKKKE